MPPGVLRELVREIFDEQLRSYLGTWSVDDLEDVTFVAASGGHQALVPALAVAQVPSVRAMVLMDAYYTYSAPVEDFAVRAQRARRFARQPEEALPARCRLHGQRAHTGADARLRRPNPSAGLREPHAPEVLGHVTTPHDVVVEDFTHPISIVRSKLGHDEVMRTDLWKALEAVR